MPLCAEDDCAEQAVVLLHIPWADDRTVCLGHARVQSQKDGVVAELLDDAADELP